MWKRAGWIPGLLVLATTSQAGVLVVASDGSGQYLDLQAAVDAAQDGDVLLVRTGTYTSFAIADRSVTVVADAGATVVVQGAARVRNVSAGRTVVLSGLRVTGVGTAAPARHGLYATSNAGHVRVLNCTFRGADGALVWDAFGWAAGVVTDCADIAFDACTFEGGASAGGDATVSITASGDGLVATQSTVTVHGGSVTGGSAVDLDTLGTTAAGWDGGDGGDGLVATSSVVHVFGSELRGGDGGNGAWYVPLYALGGNGGDGAVASASVVTFLDTTRTGGTEGWGWMVTHHEPALDGNPGVPQSGGAFVDWSGGVRRLELTRIAREGATLSYTVHGQPGDLVSIGFSAGAAYTELPAPTGSFLLSRPAPPLAAKFLILGTIPASGSLTWTSVVPDLGPGVASNVIHVQALVQDASGVRYLSGARVLLELDAAY